MSDSKKMYIGLDMGTSSVGWAVTDEHYNLRRAKGKDLWGVRLFDEAQTSAERRTYRISRRRRQREVARLALLKDYFADEIAKVDPGFFLRLEESAFWQEDRSEDNRQNYSLFADKKFTDKEFFEKYPTIFHLRKELIESKDAYDVRMVYLALANMFKHRGHFLNTTLSTEDTGSDIVSAWQAFCEKALMFDIQFSDDENTALTIENCLSTKGLSKSRIAEKLISELNVAKNEKNKVELLKMMAGCTGKLISIYGDEALDEEHKKQTLCFRDNAYEEKELEAREILGDEYFELIETAKEIHDIGLLANVMKGETHLTFARVDAYEKHKKDLQVLKAVLKKYDQAAYTKMFRIMEEGNYSAYVGSVNSDKCKQDDTEKGRKGKKRRNQGKGRSQEDLYKNIKTILKKFPEEDENVKYILAEIENEQFLPKQLTSSNGVIPNQVYVKEMKVILGNAEKYLPFLKEKDESGLPVSERILQLFSFHIPYYIGPLGIGEGKNKWAVRKEGGRVYPWNLEEKIDTAATAEEFIGRMVRRCTYLNEEQTLPKNSLMYEKFMVLNELNNLRVYGEPVSVEIKQEIYLELFEKGKKVRISDILKYLKKEAVVAADETEDCMSGIDLQGFKASLSSLGKMKSIFNVDTLTDSQKKMAEGIIFWKTVYGEDKKLLRKKIEQEYKGKIDESSMKKLLGYKFEGWGNLSKQFLELEGESKKDGSKRSIIQALWETNDNLMQLLSEDYSYKAIIESKIGTSEKPLSEWDISDLDGMYLSAPVKRMVWQTMKILGELQSVMKQEPDRIFVEMARENEKNPTRKDSRKKKLLDLYAALKKEGAIWKEEIENTEEQKFRSKKLYLYYVQKGRDIYTGKEIDFNDLFNDNLYDIDHIYPRHFVKDDSIENNLVLARKTDNAHKSDTFPIETSVQSAQAANWKMLVDQGFITKEKYQRLTRKTQFTDQELADFVSRQLVETRQGTKAITQIIAQAFPNTKVVFSKASVVSDFRHKYDLIKVRCVNDLHHAKDAYLNVVVGNTYYVKFTNSPLNFIREAKKADKKNETKYHMDKIFDFTVKRGNEIAWITDKGEEQSIDVVKKIMKKNSPLITKREYVVKTGLTRKETIWSASDANKEAYIPVKSENSPLSDVTKYGGRTAVTNMCYTLVEYKVKGKRVLSLEALPVYLGKIETLSEESIVKYLQDTLTMEYKGKEVSDIKVKYKVIRFRTKIKLDGFTYYLGGKTQGFIYLENAVPLFVSTKEEKYIHKLEKAYNNNFYCETDSEGEQFISSKKNEDLWDTLYNKLIATEYSRKKNTIKDIMLKGKESFLGMDIKGQVGVLLEVLKGFRLTCEALNMFNVGGKTSSGKCLGNKKISMNEEAKLIQTSITGLYTHEVDLLKL